MQDRQVLQKPVIPTFDITDLLSFQQQNISCELNAVFLSYHQLKNVDKLAIAYKKLFVLRSPLYMAFSYEETQGTQHRLLAQVLRSTSSYVNGSTVLLYRMVRNQCSLI